MAVSDEQAMARAIELARSAAARGNQPYGSVVVLDGEIVAEGENRVATDLDPTAHAETVAIRAACRALGRVDLAGATVYASGEPCWLCSTVIRTVGVSRVLYARTAPAGSTGGATSAFPILRAEDVVGLPPPPEVAGGLLAERVDALFAELDPGRPPALPEGAAR